MSLSITPLLITWISTEWKPKVRASAAMIIISHSKFYMDFGVEMFNKVILTYFTPLSSCGNSLTLLKSSNIDCKILKNQVLGESVIGIHSVCRGVGELIFWEPGFQLHKQKTPANSARAYFPSFSIKTFKDRMDQNLLCLSSRRHTDSLSFSTHPRRPRGSQRGEKARRKFTVFSSM